jgi:DNA-binding NtrC family response regulator
VDVVVTDLHLKGPQDFGGFRVIEKIHAHHPRLPIILMTGDHETNHAINAHKLGAYDFLAKSPGNPLALLNDLRQLIDQATAASRLAPEPGPREPVPRGDETSIIGQSRPMQIVYREIGRLANSRLDVLILGETGTGKELVARALHKHSDREHRPFIPVNCAALPETLLESELFGHERGSFTGADRRQIGRFEQAHLGTLFLDEIGDMTLATQAKLLRVLQFKSFHRLGGQDLITSDVRVIAATHHDLEKDVAAGKFRADLYHRLNRAVIHLPALRDRREDIPALARFFLRRHAHALNLDEPSLTADAIPFLLGIDQWPGNVRELENVICRALLLARGHPISAETFKLALNRPPPPPAPPKPQTIGDYIATLLAQAQRGELQNVEAAVNWEVERELYRQAIELSGGNQVKAAGWLGVSRPTMREKLKIYGLRTRPDDEQN